MIIILFFRSFGRINFWPFTAGLNDNYFFADDGDVFLLVVVEFNKGFAWHFIDGFGFGGIFFLGEGEDITFFFLFSCEFIKHLNYKLSNISFVYLLKPTLHQTAELCHVLADSLDVWVFMIVLVFLDAFFCYLAF